MNETIRADCHCHTTCSDGEFSPLALLDLALEKNLTGLSITDHDTIDAYESALPYAQKLGIDLISGIEISAEYQKASIHVLGFAFDLHYAPLHDFCSTLREKRQQRNLAICEKLRHYQAPITLEEVAQRFPDRAIGRPHIAKVMVEKKIVKDMKTAFKRYLGEKCRAHVPGFQIAVQEAITLIQAAGGFAVLAHPHCVPARLLPDLYEMPFDGIEAYYNRLNLSQVQPWLEVARKKSWLVTGGSDFHGPQKSAVSLGCSFTPPENFALLHKRFLEHSAYSIMLK